MKIARNGTSLPIYDAEGPVSVGELLYDNGFRHADRLLDPLWEALEKTLTHWLHEDRTITLEPSWESHRFCAGYGSSDPLSISVSLGVPRRTGGYVVRQYNLRDVMLEAIDDGYIESEAYRLEIADALEALAAEIRSK